MKIFHLSDLHLGKRVNEFSMLEDQADILRKIVEFAKEHRPGAVFIAGDVYDKTTPVVEAVQLFDWFLVRINELEIAVFIISGNHDNAERVAFGASLFKNSNVHIARSYNGEMRPVTVTDEYGDINIWMLPYLRPSIVRKRFPDKEIVTYSDALAVALSVAEIDVSARNALIAHQFITGAATSDSDEISVGGSENVDGGLFDGFDYVALGHLHRPQRVGRETMRYCGSPLKYSFSEADHKKSVTVVDMGVKGDVKITELPLAPLRDMRVVSGTYNEVMGRDYYSNINTDDYIRVVLTDERDEPDAMAKLRTVYRNLMGLEYDNKRTRADASLETAASVEEKTPVQLFAELFEKQNGRPMSEEQSEYVEDLFNEICREAV